MFTTPLKVACRTCQESQLLAAQLQAEESSSNARTQQAQLDEMAVQKADLSALLAQERMARADLEHKIQAGTSSGAPPLALSLPPPRWFDRCTSLVCMRLLRGSMGEGTCAAARRMIGHC